MNSTMKPMTAKAKPYGMKAKSMREPMRASKPMMKNVSKSISTPNGSIRSFPSKRVGM